MSDASNLTTASGKPRVALMLQGGGALGSYHVGAYQAMEEAGMLPDWVAGISIGAFMSALIVGNRPENRLSQLIEFWNTVSVPDDWGEFLHGDMRKTFNQMSYMRSLMFGQPNFWHNRMVNPLFLPKVEPEGASFCDTSPMLATLNRLVDFSLINSKQVRLSLGATNVTSGELEFFDNHRETIGPQHVLASGSLPPAFPPTRVNGKLYWDGGCVANTPLDAIFAERECRPDILVVIDLFNIAGPEPTNMDEVAWRAKSIQYGDRTVKQLRQWVTQHNLRCHLCHAHDRLAQHGSDARLEEVQSQHVASGMDILHLVYQPASDQISSSDVEFSRPSLEDRRKAGYKDMRHALAEKPWMQRLRDYPDEILVHHATCGHIHSQRYM